MWKIQVYNSIKKETPLAGILLKILLVFAEHVLSRTLLMASSENIAY